MQYHGKFMVHKCLGVQAKQREKEMVSYKAHLNSQWGNMWLWE